MSATVSARTARLARVALDQVIKIARPQRNGLPWLPDDIRTAIRELDAVVDQAAGSADATTLDGHEPDVRRFTEIDVRTAAHLLGITEQAVRKRIGAETLAARKLAGVWLVQWPEGDRDV